MTESQGIQRQEPLVRLPLIPLQPQQPPTRPAVAPPADGYRPDPRRQKILLVGDSHSVGPFGSEFHARARASGAQVASYGSCGSTPASWMAGTPTNCGYWEKHDDGPEVRPPWKQANAIPRFGDVLAAERPDVVVVELGANLWNRTEEAKRTATKMVDLIQAAGARCVWVGPPTGRASVVDPAIRAGMSETLRDAVAGRCTYIDSQQLTHYPARGGDGRHFGGEEGTAIAKRWADAVAGSVTAGF